MMPAVFLCAGDLAHGIVEGQAEDLDVEVNGIAGEVAFGPAPRAVVHDEAGMDGQKKIARLARDELESAFLQQRCQRGDYGAAKVQAAQKTGRWLEAVVAATPGAAVKTNASLLVLHLPGGAHREISDGQQVELAAALVRLFC